MKRKLKPRAVVVDYDDTVADFSGFLCHLHNKIHHTSIVTNDITTWEFEDIRVNDVRGNIVTGEELNRTFKEYEPEGLYAILPVISEAKSALKIMRLLGYKIIILTARKPEHEKQTMLNLLHNDVVYDELYFEEDKVKKIKELSKKYNIQVFADDKLETIEDVVENCKVRKVYLIDKAHNRTEDIDDEIIRITNLFEVVRDLRDLT